MFVLPLHPSNLHRCHSILPFFQLYFLLRFVAGIQVSRQLLPCGIPLPCPPPLPPPPLSIGGGGGGEAGESPSTAEASPSGTLTIRDQNPWLTRCCVSFPVSCLQDCQNGSMMELGLCRGVVQERCQR